MYIDTTTGQYPINERDIRQLNPSTLFPSPFVPPSRYKLVEQTPRPTYDPIRQCVTEGEPIKQGGKWVRTWVTSDLTHEQIADNQAEADEKTKADYTSALEEFFDAKAQGRRYDNRMSCAIRAGYPGPFRAEGEAFATWMDDCNAHGYQVMADVMSGDRPLPSVEEFLAELPELTWPT